jgi:hypothetical protein
MSRAGKRPSLEALKPALVGALQSEPSADRRFALPQQTEAAMIHATPATGTVHKGTDEGLTRQTSMLLAAGFWAAGLIVGVAGVWRANTAPPVGTERTASSEVAASRCDGVASEPTVTNEDDTGSEVSGALVLPEDVLVAKRRGAAEMQRR